MTQRYCRPTQHVWDSGGNRCVVCGASPRPGPKPTKCRACEADLRTDERKEGICDRCLRKAVSWVG